ncbi:hypothetical protein SKAU_G00237470 [Synaphobranchus kaupii]|uniref:Uncharacterized protein n=1 Tax=Synaphobranchus kaupii TaxID=118154 RepID=A0A9Q1ITZ6_SYNKA|nr:hypothetical protein SKAU_G00237470 [Synaphobranchus kaupii]
MATASDSHTPAEAPGVARQRGLIPARRRGPRRGFVSVAAFIATFLPGPPERRALLPDRLVTGPLTLPPGFRDARVGRLPVPLNCRDFGRSPYYAALGLRRNDAYQKGVRTEYPALLTKALAVDKPVKSQFWVLIRCDYLKKIHLSY